MVKKSLQKRNQLQSELYQKVGVIALEGGGVAIVDTELFVMLSAFRWRRVKYHRCYYARIIDGQSPPFKATTMHRVVNNTPAHMVCHHKNHNSLDNRRVNLTNMSKDLHRKPHKNNPFKLKTTDAAISDNQPSLPRPDPQEKPEKSVQICTPSYNLPSANDLQPTNRQKPQNSLPKKKPEKDNGIRSKFPISFQVLTELLNGPKPPVMNRSTLLLIFISVICRAVNDLF